MANPPLRPSAHGGQGQLRIIGGEWRSRRFSFPDAEGLRDRLDAALRRVKQRGDVQRILAAALYRQ